MKKETLQIIERVHKLFRKRALTLSVAESCTGGLISHYITTIPAVSSFFEAGVVTYSIGAKKSILGVSSGTISKYGVVSEETAREMAEKIRVISGTDFSVSTTGNLGPDALEEKAVGLVFFAVSTDKETFSKGVRFTENRSGNKELAAVGALKMLLQVVEAELRGLGD